jgi:hypothetical protein
MSNEDDARISRQRHGSCDDQVNSLLRDESTNATQSHGTGARPFGRAKLVRIDAVWIQHNRPGKSFLAKNLFNRPVGNQGQPGSSQDAALRPTEGRWITFIEILVSMKYKWNPVALAPGKQATCQKAVRFLDCQQDVRRRIPQHLSKPGVSMNDSEIGPAHLPDVGPELLVLIREIVLLRR